MAKVERALRIENLYDPQNSQLVNHLIQALKAQSLYQRDIDYVIQDGEVKIVDEFTGRIMEGRRWSEGLHQAVEAKEGVRIQEEHQTLATITLQNYFRLYEKLAGMTGTAKTEEKEFVEIYNLNVVEIPTNVAVARADLQDLVFKTKDGKFAAVVAGHQGACGEGAARARRHDRGRDVRVPVAAPDAAGREHNVLNAKEHAREAEIIKDAGQRGAVTIATNMAGRGVDIKLGDGVRELGGLYVLGTERHESRRIDNQLRGRSGRQGDPGETRFYLSGEDDLVRLFAGDRIKNIMERFKIPDDQPMEAKILSRQIEGAQKKVEEQNFVMRKNVLKYDDVMNRQRGRIYEQRRQVLEGEDMSEQVKLWIDEVVEDTVLQFTQEEYTEEWDLEALTNAMAALYQTEITAAELREDLSEISREALIEEFQSDARDEYDAKEEEFGAELMRELERFVILQVVDVRWREHLENMDYLREGDAPAGDGAEGSARRVHGRGRARVHRAQPLDPRRGRAPSVPRGARARAAATAARAATAERQRERSATSTRPRRARMRWPPPAERRSGSHRSRCRPASRSRDGTTRAGAGRARSTRSATAHSRLSKTLVTGTVPITRVSGSRDTSARPGTIRSDGGRTRTHAARAARGDRGPARLGPWLPLTSLR